MGGALVVSRGSKNNGAIVVKRSSQLTLGSLLNVKVNLPKEGDVLIYDSDTETWIAGPPISKIIDGGNY